MLNNPDNRKEETYMNNKSDIHDSNTQVHLINNVQNNWGQTGNIKQTTTNSNIDKPDKSINTQTCYGRLNRKPDRLTYH